LLPFEIQASQPPPVECVGVNVTQRFIGLTERKSQ
jgi:hypothetical protein